MEKPNATYTRVVNEECSKSASGKTIVHHSFYPASSTKPGTESIKDLLSFFMKLSKVSAKDIKIENSKTDSGSLNYANCEQAYIETILLLNSSTKNNNWMATMQDFFTSIPSYSTELLTSIIRQMYPSLAPNDSITDEMKADTLRGIRTNRDKYVNAVLKYFESKPNVSIPGTKEGQVNIARDILNVASKVYLVQGRNGEFSLSPKTKYTITYLNNKREMLVMSSSGQFDKKETVVDVHVQDSSKKKTLTSRPSKPMLYYAVVDSRGAIDNVRLYLTKEMQEKKNSEAEKNAQARDKLSSIDGPIITLKTQSTGCNRGKSDNTYRKDRHRYALLVLRSLGIGSEALLNNLEMRGTEELYAITYNEAVKDKKGFYPSYDLIPENPVFHLSS